MKGRYIIIPIETKAREFYSKLLLSCVLVEHGCRVIIGGARQVRGRLPIWPRGLFLDKSVSPSRARLFGGYKKWGHRIAAWCEEGLTIVDANEYLPRKIDRQAMREIEQFYAWGSYHASLVKGKCPESAHKIVPAGNPRIDLLRKPFRDIFDREVEKLNDRYGRFILINTNFSLCNHQKGNEAFMRLQKGAGKLKTKEDIFFAHQWIAHKTSIFEAFKAFIPKLCDLAGDVTVIIRPHPSEDHGTWSRLVEKFENCHVVYKGTVVPWILASDILIHNGCTTGIEAYLLDRPVLAYRPVISDTFDAKLPNFVSEQVYTEAELLRRAMGIVRSKELPVHSSEQKKLIGEYISQTDGELSSEFITRQLIDIMEKSRGVGRLKIIISFLCRILWKVMHSGGVFVPSTAYSIQKFPGLTKEEVEQGIATFIACSGRYAGVNVTSLGNDCFLLQKR